MNSILFFEFFFKQFRDMEEEQQKLIEQLQRRRGVCIVAQRLYDLNIRMTQTNRIFELMRPWYMD